jgi:acyl-coenzyme A thioesterase PaaI-like protein
VSDRPTFSREAPDRLSELARGVHGVMEAMLRVDEGDPGLDDDLAWAVARTREIRERLARHARGHEVRLGVAGDAPGGRPYYVRGALVGEHHPMSLDMQISTEDGLTRGSVRFDLVWEGPPGCVHGGYVAYLYDCIMGHHTMEVGVRGMTGSLSVRYRRPTPLYTDLDFEVRTARISGRKIVDEAVVRANGEVVSEAQGLFIVPRDFVENIRGSAP